MTVPTRWEYRVATIGGFWGAKDAAIEIRLNELGLEGWEVVGLHVTATDKMRVVAKRPLTDTARRRRRMEYERLE
jgi:hypothetical protein